MEFGLKLKTEREERSLLLREVAANISIDTALLSKIERGKRQATRNQVIKLSKLFNFKNNELLNLWLGEKIAYSIYSENSPKEILKVAESAIKYLKV